MSVPFIQEREAVRGTATRISPLVRRVVADNPSVFTYHGTGTFIVGHGEVAVIDAGPALERHVEAILDATRGETITHQFITHTHSDHSPAARLLKHATGAEIWAWGPATGGDDGMTPVDESEDHAFAPDHLLHHGDRIAGARWTIEAVHTPGHASNHMCYALQEEKTLFSGDHVMGWSTTVVSPPDGDMAAYLDSLELVLERGDAILRPTHGAAITDPATFVRALIDHRRMRDRQIIACLDDGIGTIPSMVETLYATTDRRLFPAARRSVLAHIIRLVHQGLIEADGTPDERTRYRLKTASQ
ncbi:MAG: MBL fold metallo-hydrolase [bacterium]|nr:MBL fold metallo-hydrolase [bacterium]